MFEGTLNGAPLNELAVNDTPAEPVYLSEAVAAIRIDVQGNPQVRGNIFASTAIAALVLAGEGDSTVNPSSAGLSALRLIGEGQATVSPSSEGIAALRLAGLGAATVSPSSEGVADVRLRPRGELTLNPSSDGVARLRVDVLGDVTVSGGVDSGGIAKLRLRTRLAPYVWTYLYNEGRAEMRLTGLVNPRYRPRLPSAFHPALDRMPVAAEAWRGVVVDDGAAMPVRPDRNRLTVPKEKTP